MDSRVREVCQTQITPSGPATSTIGMMEVASSGLCWLDGPVDMALILIQDGMSYPLECVEGSTHHWSHMKKEAV